MEDKLTEEIWQECQKFISFGAIDHFIRQMKVKKPHIVIQKFQFLQTEGQSQARPNFYNNNPQMRNPFNIEIDESEDAMDGDENFDNMYLFDDMENEYFGMMDYIGGYEYYNDASIQEDALMSIHIQVYDNEEKKQKTLTVFFLEQNKNIPHKEIMNVKSHVQGILRNDLIIKIYDMYYLQTNQISHYLVVEHELVYMELKQFQLVNKNLNEEEIKQIKIKSTCLLDANARDNLYQMLDFYVVKQNSNEILIKLSPISNKLLHLFSSCQGFQSQEERNKKKEQQKNKKNQKEVDELENQFSLIILNKIEQQSLISKENLLRQIEENHSNLLQVHNRQIFEIISQHPKYHQFQLDKFGEDYFIFQIQVNNKNYLLKGEKFKSQKEAENLKQLYNDFCFEDNPIFIPIIDCQLIVFEDNAYILVEELLLNEDNQKQIKQSYTLRQFIELDSDVIIEQKKKMFDIIIQFYEKLNFITNNKLFSHNLDFIITNFKQDLDPKCYFTNSLFLKNQENNDYCTQKSCKYRNSNSTKLMKLFFEIVIIFFDSNFQQPENYDCLNYDDIFYKFIDFTCFHENNITQIYNILRIIIFQAQQMFKIKQDFQQVHLFLNYQLEISIQNDNPNFTKQCIQKFQIKDLRSEYNNLIQLINLLTNQKNDISSIECFSQQQQDFPFFNYENKKNHLQLPKVSFNFFQKLQKLQLTVTIDQFISFNLSSLIQIQTLNEFLIMITDCFKYNQITINDEQSFIQQHFNLVNLFKMKKNFQKITLEGIVLKEFNNQIQKFVQQKSYFQSIIKLDSRRYSLNQKKDINVLALEGGKKKQYYQFFQMLNSTLDKLKQKYPLITYQVEDQYNNDKSLIQVTIQSKEFPDFGYLTIVILKDTKMKLQIDSINCRSIERSRHCQNKFRLEKIEDVVLNWLIIEKQTSNINTLSSNILSPVCWHDDTNQLYVQMFSQQADLKQMILNLQLCETIEKNMLQNQNYLGLSNNNILKNLHELQLVFVQPNLIFYKLQSFSKGIFNNLKDNKTIIKIILTDVNKIISKRIFYKLPRLVVFNSDF